MGEQESFPALQILPLLLLLSLPILLFLLGLCFDETPTLQFYFLESYFPRNVKSRDIGYNAGWPTLCHSKFDFPPLPVVL